jgi:hypothetical protein
MMNFDMVDYDALKYLTYPHILLFCVSRQPLLRCPTSCIRAVVMHPPRYAAPSIAVFGGNNPLGAKQKKVSRLRVREPDQNQSSR